MTTHATEPLQITPEQVDADQGAAIRLATWWLTRRDLTPQERLDGASAVIEAEGPWLMWCRLILSRRRVHGYIDNLQRAAAADARRRRAIRGQSLSDLGGGASL